MSIQIVHFLQPLQLTLNIFVCQAYGAKNAPLIAFCHFYEIIFILLQLDKFEFI